jgi:hypothetical protein
MAHPGDDRTVPVSEIGSRANYKSSKWPSRSSRGVDRTRPRFIVAEWDAAWKGEPGGVGDAFTRRPPSGSCIHAISGKSENSEDAHQCPEKGKELRPDSWVYSGGRASSSETRPVQLHGT